MIIPIFENQNHDLLRTSLFECHKYRPHSGWLSKCVLGLVETAGDHFDEDSERYFLFDRVFLNTFQTFSLYVRACVWENLEFTGSSLLFVQTTLPRALFWPHPSSGGHRILTGLSAAPVRGTHPGAPR